MAVVLAVDGRRRSRRAVRWAVDNLSSSAESFVLVHVAPPATFIPSPSGKKIPVKEMSADAVALYLNDVKLKSEELFLPFKKICGTKEVETVVLEDDNAATALLRYMYETGVKSIVLGTSSTNCILRKLKKPGVHSIIIELAPHACNVYVVSQNKVVSKLAINVENTGATIANGCQQKLPQKTTIVVARSFSSVESGKKVVHEELTQKSGAISISHSYNNDSKSSVDYPNVAKNNNLSTNGHSRTNSVNVQSQAFDDEDASFILSQSSDHSFAQVEVDRLRLELQNTLALYKSTCEDLVIAKKKAQLLFAEYSDESMKVQTALENEEQLKRNIEEEKAKHLIIMREVEEAHQLFVKESIERERAETIALKESYERKKVLDSLLSSDKRYKRYTAEEIELATDGFSEIRKIGEGGYGKVYKCSLDHTLVAVKTLRFDAPEKKEEFLKEVEVLSQLRHPNLVMLLGACPENGCLVYEYLENGSLHDQLFGHKSGASMPWFVRLQIILSVARGLAFLHGMEPEPIVHRDLKPGNILLDKNYRSKIGDVGLAKFLSNVVPDSVTEYHDTVLAGTLYYMDPEYQRTGTLRPKSDLYALGIIILQLLTGKKPSGLLTLVENKMKTGSLRDILDKSIMDWPLIGPDRLAQIALKCSRLRCRDRPELDSEVIPQLEELLSQMDGRARLQLLNIQAPSHFFCPIMQDVMNDPYIAADGYTYEHLAIKKWLEKHSASPVTKTRLPHNRITPNHSLRSAIKEWKQKLAA